MRRLFFVSLFAFGLTGAVFFVTVAAPHLLGHQPPALNQQPIAFDHEIHVQQLGVQCEFCHRTATTGMTAGYPDVQQCMFCHQTIGQGQAEIEKVRTAWAAQEPVDWTRVNRLPDHVHFAHDAHIAAGVACETCHGDVAKMTQVTQARALNMGDCVACHEQNNAPTDCVTCHY
jgi:hypothetical protein